jgi:inner membrane protein
MPRLKTVIAKAVFLATFVVLGNLPDLPVRNWGHHRYYISHSLFVNLAFIAVLCAALRLWRRGPEVVCGWPVLAGGATAWLSHLLLDSFYNHGLGVAIFWPFSDASLALPVPGFDTRQRHFGHLDPRSVRIYLIELACYLPLLVAAAAWRKRGAPIKKAKRAKPGQRLRNS